MMKARLASAVLVMQGITTLLALPVISAVTEGADANKSFVIIIAVLLLLVPGVLRRPGGYYIGQAVQGLAFIAAFKIPTLLILTAIFFGLWVMALRGGSRIDRDRAALSQG
ncbi:MAG: hypothetical protein RL410_1288 [Actinomycetota bacterium]|jgi:TM2 domain-containing membrane protein YozV